MMGVLHAGGFFKARSGVDQRRRLVGGAIALIAIFLLALAIPRTVGVIILARSEATMQKLQSGQPVQFAELTEMARTQEAALFWLGDGRLRTDLGLTYLLITERLRRDDPNYEASLQRAVDALRTGLARAPANAYAWARLAYAEALARGWSPLAVASLRLALITAPYEPQLLWSRLRMAFLAWPEMTGDDQEVVYQQIRYAWQTNPPELARLASELNRTDLVRAALQLMPDDSAVFEELLKTQQLPAQG